MRTYYLNNKPKVREASKKWYASNKTSYLETCKKYRDKNKEQISKYQSEWYQKNKEKVRSGRTSYMKLKRSIDPVFKLAGNMRVRIGFYIKSKNKSKSTEILIGCTFESLKKYLELRFQEGMSWENYGKWHVDHIVPLSSAKNCQEVEKLCHFSNLQPLWALENKKKSDKVA